MVGDDFQIPSIGTGMLHMFDTYGNKTICEMNGERIFTEFALNTMEGTSRYQTTT